MPARWLKPKCRHIFTLIGLVFLVPISVEAQSANASVTLSGRVSETVTLSVPPNFNADVVSSGGNTVRIRVSGNVGQSPVIQIPLLVRSNTAFKVSALFESQTAGLAELSVVEKQATGRFVSPQAIGALESTSQSEPDVSRPLLVFSGPRVSLGGTLNSANNALQVTVLIRLNPSPQRDWSAHLTFVATAESLIQ